MPFDFPNSPIEGQIFAPPGGPRYKFQAQVWDVLGPEEADGVFLHYEAVNSNTWWNPVVAAEEDDYFGYPPAEEPDRYFNVVISPGFQGFDNGIDIVRSTLVGHASGEMLRGCVFTDAYGADALKFAKWSNRNTIIGSLGTPWLGQDLTTDTSHNPAYPSVQRYYEHDTLQDNGVLWTDPAWDPHGSKARSPGCVTRITNWVNSNPWADSQAGSDKSAYVIANVAVGRDALNQMVIGSNNTAVGYRAVALLLDGSYNTGVGYQAGYMNAFASGNVSIGAYAGRTNQDGGFNTAVGYKAGNGVIHGVSNVCIGTGAGSVGVDPETTVDVTMNRSVFIGSQAGYGITSTTIDDKLYVGNLGARGPLIAGDFVTGQVVVGVVPTSPVMDWQMGSATFTVYSGDPGVATIATAANDIVIKGSASSGSGITIATPNTQTASLFFADPEHPSAGSIQYNHASDYMRFMVNVSERLRLTTTGMGFNGATAVAKPIVTGAKGANAALAALLTALASYGLITDSTTA